MTLIFPESGSTMEQNRRRSILLLILTSGLWSMAGVLMRYMTWSGPQVAGARSLIAALTILAYIKKPNLHFTRRRVAAIVSYALTVMFFAVANKMTTAANAILLQYTGPIYSALLGWFFLREKIRRWDLAAIAVILGGVALLVRDGLSTGNWMGDIAALLSGVTFGAMSVFMRMEKDNDPVQSVFWGNVICFLAMLPFMGALEITAANGICILVLGVFQLGLSYILYTKAVPYVSALEIVIFSIGEPVLNPVWVILFQREVPGPWTVAGGAVIILAVVGREVWRNRSEVHAPPTETQEAVSQGCDFKDSELWK